MINFSFFHIISFILIALTIGLLTTPYYKLAVGPPIAIFLFSLLSKFPRFGYYTVIFLIPLGAYRVLPAAVKSLKIHWIISFWLIVIILFETVMKKHFPEKLKSNLWFWISIFFVISMLSATKTIYYETSINNLVLLLVAVSFIIINLYYTSVDAFRRIIPLVITYSICISSLLSILGYFFNISLFAEKVETGSFKRAIGTTVDPNIASLVIVFGTPFLFHWIIYAKRGANRLLALIFFILNMIALIITFSRGGIIIMSIALFLIFLNNISKIKPLYFGLLLSAILVALLTLVAFTPTSYWERLHDITSPTKDKSIGRRASYLYVGMESFTGNPLLGAGPGSFRDIYAESEFALQFTREGQTLRRYAHNTYLEVLVGTGFLGLGAFLFLIRRGLKNYKIARNVFKNNGDFEMSSIITSYRIAFIALLLYLFLFSDIYHKYLLMSLALSQVALNLAKERESGMYGNVQVIK